VVLHVYCEEWRNAMRRVTIASILFVFMMGLCALAAPQGSTPGQSTASTRLDSWMLGSTLPLAALGNAQGVSKESLDQYLAPVQSIAQKLGTRIPPLPQRTGDHLTDAQAFSHYLTDDVTQITESLSQKYPPDTAALFDLALQCFILEASYSDELGGSKAIEIANLATIAGLPQYMWQPVVFKMNHHEPIDKVKEALRKMDSDVTRHLTVALAK
jgi:hypothetical protein